MVLVRLQERRGVVRFAFAGVAAASDHAAPSEHAAHAVRAEHAARAVHAAAQRVRLSVQKGVNLLRPGSPTLTATKTHPNTPPDGEPHAL
jgi:hypothetical protein